MIVGIKDRALHLLKQFAGGLALAELDANRQEIHAVADEIAIFEE